MKMQFLLILLISPLLIVAQSVQKKLLQVDDFAQWKIIENQQLSNNGKLVSFELNPQQGDGLLLLTNLESGKVDSIPRGAAALFTPDSKFLIFRQKIPVKTQKTAKRKKLKPEQMPLDSLGIFSAASGKIKTYGNLESWKLPEEDAAWLPFTVRPDSTITTKDDAKRYDLVLYHFENGDTILKRQVTDFFVAKKGKSIIYTSCSPDSGRVSRVFLFDTKSGSVKKIFENKGSVKKVTTNEKGDQYAFLFSPDTTKQKTYELCYGRANSEHSGAIVKKDDPAMPVNRAPSEHQDVVFSKDGSRIYFGTARINLPEQKDSLINDEKPVLDIWSWTDTELMSQQKVNLEKEKKKTYLAVYDLNKKQFSQLADTAMQEVRLTMDGNGHLALGKDPSPYRKESSWTGRASADYYAVDIKNNTKTRMVNDITVCGISPLGKYVFWFDPSDSCYYARSANIINDKKNALTKNLPVNFYQELRDIPMEVSPYGVAGWAKDDRFIYIYDRYDIWKIDPSGERPAVNLTSGYGRDNKIALRYVKLDPEEKFIPDGKVLIRGLREWDKSEGYYHLSTKTAQAPAMLVMSDHKYLNVKKAKHADRLIWTKERSEVYPDIWTSGTDFKNIKKISNANPQISRYNWVRAKIIRWTSFSGDELAGVLYLPEDFDPAKKYPLIVYFYERSTDQIHQHIIPAPSRSVINKTVYASNGYLIFDPDITYKTGYPGESAFNAVLSGTNYLINNFSYIDKERIGMQGQSWGGYQTAYLISKTALFAAAMAGAPVSNMTSAYGGIRSETGISRMSQYEHTQSRIGGTLWERLPLYLENSPLFYAPKITTPLLIMHNDNDGAVPWSQGIELFTAMRRLDKPAWLLNYNNEPHNLKKESWENRIDLSIRMKQFFDHYLKEAPMPSWMMRGLPAIEKGKTLGY